MADEGLTNRDRVMYQRGWDDANNQVLDVYRGQIANMREDFRSALLAIIHASRDEGLEAMVHEMRHHALANLKALDMKANRA